MHDTQSIIAKLQALMADESLTLSDRARERLSWLLHYYQTGTSVSDTCRKFDIARVTFYRLLQKFDLDHPETLEDKPSFTQTPTVSEKALSLIREYRIQDPLAGKERIAHLLFTEHGMRVSATLVGKIISREGLYFAPTPLHRLKRLQYGVQGPEEVSMLNPTSLAQKFSEPVTSAASGNVCDCFYCRVRHRHAKKIKRTFVTASIITNIAIAGLVFLTALVESRTTVVAETPSLESSLLQP
jgi:transposase